MSAPPRLSFPPWLIVPIFSLGFLLWVNHTRSQRVELITGMATTPAVSDTKSATGYAGGQRMLIVPGQNKESYQWIAQTQQMIAEGHWRLRRVEYDNAPIGREVRTPVPYRWWLAALGWCDHQLSGRSIGLSVEQAALWADPLLHYLLLAGTVAFAALRFGAWSAVLLSLGMATMFPFGSAFLPGTPSDFGLSLGFALWSVLPVLAGVINPPAPEPQNRRWFLLAGIIGGFALWVNVGAQTPILIGIGLGGLTAAMISRRREKGKSTAPLAAWPWRVWGIGGASTTLVCSLLENAPDRMTLGVDGLAQIHPLYALGWLGGGELLKRACDWLQGGKLVRGRGDGILAILAASAVLVLPVLMLAKSQRAFLTLPTYATTLTGLVEGVEADNLLAWLARDGFSLAFWATVLPLGLVLVAGWRLWKNTSHFAVLATALGPLLIAIGFGCWQLSWWSLVNAMLLALLVVLGSKQPGIKPALESRILDMGGLLLLTSLGLVLSMPARNDRSGPVLSKNELLSLVERDFAHWLARRMGPDGANVLAPPTITTSLYYHGGLRGLGSPYRENEEGFRASVRLAAAVQADEAQALARQRKLTHIIIPSWDGFLDEYARLGANQPEKTLMGMLHNWLPPRWLRPVPYYLPNIKELAEDRLLVFETTEVQDQASSLSRLAEYFLDMGQIELASMVAQTLASEYSADLGAQVARARTAKVRRDQVDFTQSLGAIMTGLEDGSGDSLGWDRRVSLCLVLAEGDRITLARTQVQRCLDEMGELELRGLSEATLFRFLNLCQVSGLKIQDNHLRELAKTLLPPQMRASFSAP